MESYPYGMNGQEKSNEIFEGATTAEYWEYDSRLGRRWNKDPIVKPWESPYACFAGDPILYADPSGLTAKEGEGDGSKGKDAAFPSNPKDGQEHIRYDKEHNANWGYVYDGTKKEWVGTGAATTLNSVEVNAKYTPTGMRKIGGMIAHFLTNSHFVLKFSGEVEAGLAVSGEGTIWGQKASVEASILNAKLLKGSIDLAAKTSDPNMYTGSYAGKNNVTEMSQGISGSFTNYLSAGYEHSWDATNIMSDGNGGYKNEKHKGDFTVFIPLLKKSNSNETMKQTMGNTAHDLGTVNVKASDQFSTDKTFVGLDLGAKVQVIIGAGVSVKIGLEED